MTNKDHELVARTHHVCVGISTLTVESEPVLAALEALAEVNQALWTDGEIRMTYEALCKKVAELGVQIGIEPPEDMQVVDTVHTSAAEGNALKAVRRIQARRRYGRPVAEQQAAMNVLALRVEELARENGMHMPVSIKIGPKELFAMISSANGVEHAQMLLEQTVTGDLLVSQVQKKGPSA